MSKQSYINDLEKYLNEKLVSKKDITLVLEDYSNLYDEAKDSGLSDIEVIEKLGSAETIYEALKDDLKHQGNKHNRIVAITPFVAIITFYLLGFLGNLWAYSWMAFLIIPVTAIIFNVKGKDRFIALTPFLSLIAFMIIGFTFKVWHPTWLVFLSIPVTAITLNVKGVDKIIALSPFAITVAYIIIIMFIPGFHIYGWAMFAITPILAIILKPFNLLRYILLITIILAVLGHQLIGHLTHEWQYAWMVYLVPMVFAFFIGDIQFGVEFKKYKTHPILLLCVLLTLTAYLTVSILIPNTWYWSWIILLVIPMLGIYSSMKFKTPVAYMPFISTILFMSLGFFLDLWQYAWLVYLLIPMVAILTNQSNKTDETDE